MTAALPPDPSSPLAPLAPALRRLARARALELWVRTAIWVWCTALVGWLLPLGSWSVTRLSPPVAVAVGVAMLAVGALLAYAYRSLSSTAEVRAAMEQVRFLHRTARDSRPEAGP
jgi:hypothetical protein